MTDSSNERPTASKSVGPHRSLRVLFVDDEAPLREFMRCELPRLGHEVTVCQDGRAAIKVLEKSSFDAAILDLRMPGMSGIDVLEHLKRISPDTEAVVMTGVAPRASTARRVSSLAPAACPPRTLTANRPASSTTTTVPGAFDSSRKIDRKPSRTLAIRVRASDARASRTSATS